WMLKLVMRFRIPVAIVAVLVVASSYPLYKAVKQDYLPSDVDEAEFEMRVTAPEGASFTATNQVMLAIERDLMAMPQIRTILSSAGGGYLGGVNQGEVYVRIAPHGERIFSLGRLWRETLKGDPMAAFKGNYSQRDVMQQIRAKMRQYPDVRVSVRNFPSFSIGGGNFDVDFVVRGPELESLAKYTEQLRTRAQEMGGFTDLDTTLKLDKPELRVNIDRERAADLGVTSQDVGTALRLMVGGDTEISRFRDPATNEDYDVQLRLLEQYRNDPAEVPRLYLPGRNNQLIELRNLATVEEAKTAARIDRLDRQRSANVRGGVAPGYALADRLEALRQIADDMNLPPAYTTRVSGRGRELERTFNEFIWAFLLSIIFMYMILAANYESLIHPVTILLSLPLSIPFALLSLWLTGGSLNLYSALGILVLFGVVKKNSILQIDHMNHLRHEGLSKYDAIIQGNRDRLRPILMTTLALVGGMLPLAIGTGPGSEERRAVAIVVIGGQTLSLLLTLLVTPVAYSFLDRLDFRRKPKLASASVRETGHEAREPVEVG
ncbi:MAG: efflux RND transporter permease subunit, partial [Tepidisphaeraceae bacterium]